MHQFAIGADPLTLDGAEPAASSALAKGDMLHTGDSGSVTADLKRGKYVLYCLLGGHYQVLVARPGLRGGRSVRRSPGIPPSARNPVR